MGLRTVNGIMLEQRAAAFATRSVKKSAKVQALRTAAGMVDLTTLEGKDSPEKVRGLCQKAVRPMADDVRVLGARVPSVAAVCVYPSMVKVAADELARLGAAWDEQSHCGVRVASVATAFPSGQAPLDVRLRDTQAALDEGADEIDMVINRGAFLSGKYDVVAQEIREVQQLCVGAGKHLKVILETGELETYDNIRRASDLAIGAMADACGDNSGDVKGGFIKTSTGKVAPAATMPVTLLMLEAIRDHHMQTGHVVGMKPAGGIRTAKQAIAYLAMLWETLGDAWMTPDLFRFGASSLLNDLLRQLSKQATGSYVASYDLSVS